MIEFSTTEFVLLTIALVVLLLLNAIFVATEFSLVKLRFTRFGSGKMEEAKQSKSISTLLENMSDSIKVVRLGITSSTIAMGFLLVPIVLAISSGSGITSLGLAMVVAAIIAVGVHFILGELTPRAIALQHPIQSLKISVPVVQFFRFISKPYAVFLNTASSLILRFLRIDPSLDLNVLDVEAQIRSIVSEGDELPELAENIVSNTLDLRKLVAHDIMIPRNQLRYFDTEDSIEENLKIARETGHTRFPLCEGDLDHCIGIIHIKDVFHTGQLAEKISLGDITRPMVRFSMDDPLERVLQVFLKQKKHFALLTDDFGGTVGAITLEDVLEELVGEIQDEFDKEEVMIKPQNEGYFNVNGLTPLHDVSEMLGIELKASEVSTFGGMITYELGRMPVQGEVFQIDRLEITASVIDERRVVMAKVKVIEPEEVESESSDEETTIET